MPDTIPSYRVYSLFEDSLDNTENLFAQNNLRNFEVFTRIIYKNIFVTIGRILNTPLKMY